MTLSLLARGRAATATLALTGVASLAALTAPAADALPAAPATGASPSAGLTLTPAAQEAGVAAGDATMGWRGALDEQDSASASRSAAKFTPTGVLGIDVSRWQGSVNWSSWSAKGKSFAYVKATEGNYYKNPYFAQQYNGSYAVGMVRGAYHFANPTKSSGKAQAAYFVARGGGWSADGRTLPGVLDIEYNPYGKTCYGFSKAKMVSWVSSFTREYHRLTGRHAVIYTTRDWWSQCTGNSRKFSKTHKLWVARYGTTTPGTLPGGWTRAWFWQYSSNPIDQNRFYSSKAQLRAYALGKYKS